MVSFSVCVAITASDADSASCAWSAKPLGERSCAFEGARAFQASAAKAASGLADVNGTRLHCETNGRGPAVVLINRLLLGFLR
jgi:hypothetical protein